MEKRYQVFVSSTYVDLKDERQQVIQALLAMDCIPVGMEMFPASNDDQWTLIKRVIDDSDYYVLIVGNRYGSLDQTGISYTEKEYDYAVKTGKPIMAFLHADPDTRPANMSELDAEKRKKLEAFRDKAKTRMCQSWKTPEDLSAKTILSLNKTFKSHPAEGWIRGQHAAGPEMLAQMNSLRNRIAELEAQLVSVRTSAPEGTEDLAHGEDVYSVDFTYREQGTGHLFRSSVLIMWSDLFAAAAPTMFNEARESVVKDAIEAVLDTYLFNQNEELWKVTDTNSYRLDQDTFHCILTQFKALGLTTLSQRKRAPSDSSTYWTLTPYGDMTATQLIAIRRLKTPAPELALVARAEPDPK